MSGDICLQPTTYLIKSFSIHLAWKGLDFTQCRYVNGCNSIIVDFKRNTLPLTHDEVLASAVPDDVIEMSVRNTRQFQSLFILPIK